ncbi:MAG: hypothetical protein Q7R32_01550, partial [Dehalococcoidia bacterium]|nr:hypothetical protein [Dehalococcoidia bacterium]
PLGMDMFMARWMAEETARRFAEARPDWTVVLYPHITLGTDELPLPGSVDGAQQTVYRALLAHGASLAQAGFGYAVVGLKVPDRQKFFLLTFEAFEVLEVKEVSESEAEDSDFWLELTFDRWQELLQNIKTNGKADLHHTLNTIDLEDLEGFARSRDGYRRDAFYRFNQSFQHFFDSSAKIDTTFA